MTNEITKTTKKHRGRPMKLPTTQVFAEIYENHSNAEIADMYGVTISTVQKMARKNDMRKTETGRPGSAPMYEELVELCKHHTDKEIAEIHNVCTGTVAYWRKKAGITKYNKVA